MKTLLKKPEKVFGAAIHTKNFGRSEHLLVEVTPEKVVEVAAWLRMEESFRMDFLENMSIYEAKGKFVISYFLRSNSKKIQLVLRTAHASPQSDEPINFPSVIGIWSQAEAFENEQAALFGFRFVGANPNPPVRREFGEFLNYPLRKSFEWGNSVKV